MSFADSMSKKETMIRRKDFRGAHVWIGTCWFMSSRISIRFSGRKMTGSSRFCEDVSGVFAITCLEDTYCYYESISGRVWGYERRQVG